MSLHKRTGSSISSISTTTVVSKSSDMKHVSKDELVTACSTLTLNVNKSAPSNILEICKILKGLAKICLKYYQGLHKDNLNNYSKFIEHVSTLSNTEKVEILKYQINEIKSMYSNHQANIDKEYLIFMFDSNISI